ncbi:MAG TPA: peroxiredoxin [Gemmatimonadaceae bacterium]|nr:peroxiredoxin [Gemmatimonadaceae bacterium]
MSVIRYFLGAAAVAGSIAVLSSSSFAQTTANASAPAAVAPAPPPPPETIDIGKIAPDFTLPWADSIGPRSAPLRLSSLRGKVVVLAFYPGDRTTGCTAELTKFRDEYAKMFAGNTVVIPISADSIASHVSWAQDMKFPFSLASDTDLSVADQYGSHMAGRKTSGRTVFVIGKDGTILWRNLKFGALNEGAYTELAAEVAKAQ